MTRCAALLLAMAVVVAAPFDAHALSRRKRNALGRVIAPSARGTAAAHPFVNVIVRFGATSKGVPADPATFRARLGGKNVTAEFHDIVENGAVVGKRARLVEPPLRVGKRSVNRLRTSVRSIPTGKRNRRVRDADRLRFRAVDAPNQAPTAHAAADGDIILPGVPLTFFSAGSLDLDDDEITFLWDFGDGTTSSEPNPTHVFGEGVTGSVDVRLSVDDGQTAASDEVSLIADCPLDEGRTPGILHVDAATRLELGAVPEGATQTATFVVRNDDVAETSQLHVCLGTSSKAFRVDPDELDLAAGQEAPVTLTFAPTTAGHHGGVVTGVASAANRFVIRMLAHGYGGAAPGTGPIASPTPAFTNEFVTGTFGILPSGQRFFANNFVDTCQDVDGTGTGDACVVNKDCVNPGESCTPEDAYPLEPVDICGDGEGGFYLLSDEGTFTEPKESDNTEISVTLLHLQFDAAGNRTGAEILDRTTILTTQMACDGRRPGQNGRLFIARFEEIESTEQCFRDEREALVAVRKGNGSKSVLGVPIDKAVGEDVCDGDLDQVGDLEATTDGSSVFASFQGAGGIYRILGPSPTPLRILQEIDDTFRVHPDGAILYVRPVDVGTSAFINLYKLFPEQALTGAPRLDELTPCATFRLPNNGGRTFIGDAAVAVGPVSAGSLDATVLASFIASEGQPPQPELPRVLGRALAVQGTVAFSSPAGNLPCTAQGLVNVELLEPLSF